MSETIGVLQYSLPRAIQVREPETPVTSANPNAVHGDVAIHVDGLAQAHLVLDNWALIMQAAADRAAELLSSLVAVQANSEGTLNVAVEMIPGMDGQFASEGILDGTVTG
jgi:hypothetical protein